MLKTNFFSLKKVNPKKVIYNITFAEPFSKPKKIESVLFFVEILKEH